MHIPDGFLTGEAAAIGTATAIVGLAVCLRGAKRTARERDLPVAGLAAAFFVVGDAPLVPLGLGTQAHLLGGALAIALLGPWLGALTITVVCLIQAFVFGDGGITTLGMTITYLALIPAFIGYPILSALRTVIPLPIAAGLTASICVLLAAGCFAFVITFGAGADVNTQAIATATLGAYAVVAVIEGILTGLVIKGLLALRPDLLREASHGMIHFVGAGPGAPDLLTLRAVKVLQHADIVVWARSLVDEAILEHTREGAELIPSDNKTFDDVLNIYKRAAAEDLDVARVHSGDPTLYGTLHEQLGACRALGLETEIVPGVSSLSAAAAALGQELTIPDVSQSLILTRRAQRTSMPANEQLTKMAAHGTTMALFLSVRRPRELQADLIEGGYAPDTPTAVVYKASWPDEIVIRCPLANLGDEIRAAKITTQALVLVGPALGAHTGGQAHVYDPGYGHRYRPLGRPDRYKHRA